MLAEIVGAGSIVTGLTFGWFQLRHFRDQQRDTITTSFETMGLLVFRRIATMDLVLDLAGGIVTTMNRKLRRWQNDMRSSQDQPSWGEWFEWLGDRAEKVKRSQTPAHVQHQDWKR